MQKRGKEEAWKDDTRFPQTHSPMHVCVCVCVCVCGLCVCVGCVCVCVCRMMPPLFRDKWLQWEKEEADAKAAQVWGLGCRPRV